MAFKAGAIYGEALLNTKGWTTGLSTMQKSTVLGMTAITAAFTATMLTTGKLVNEWNKELTNVATLIDTNVISVDALASQLLHLNPELGNTTELTRGLYEAFSAGARTAEEAMEITTTSAKFAKAGLIDTFTAVDVLTTAINAYGKANMSAEHAADVFFTTIKLGKVVGEELASSIGTSIPLYASVGISMEELTSGLATMTKQGINAHKSTTQLNAIVNSFLKPSKQMIEQLQGVGYESGAAFLAAEGLAGAMDLITKATDLDATRIAELVPNIRGLRGVMALTGVGAEEFNYIMGEMSDVAGANQLAFEKQDKVWATAKNSMHKLGLEVGATSKKFIDELLRGVTDLSTKFINLDDTTKSFVSNLVVIGAAVGLASLAVVGLHAAFVALAANPIGAVLIGIGLLTTGAITLAKTLNDKAITEADERFKEVGMEVGIAAEKTDELAQGMISLETYFKGISSNKNPYATVITAQEGMKRQVQEIAERWGMTEEQIISVALSSENITSEQKKMLNDLRLQIIDTKALLTTEEKILGIASGITSQKEAARLTVVEEKRIEDELIASLEEKERLEKEADDAAVARKLAELARVESVKIARIAAEDAHREALSQTQARIHYGLVTEQEALEENKTAYEALNEAIIALGYDQSTIGDEGNKVLDRNITALDIIIGKIEEITNAEKIAAEFKETIWSKSMILMQLLQGKRGKEHLAMLQLIKTGSATIAEEITAKEDEELEKRKQLYRDWFSFVTSGTRTLLSTVSSINDLATQNALDSTELEYREKLEALQNNLDNSVITQAEYDAQLAIMDQDKLDKENAIKKKAFESNKNFDKANVWMSAADAIMSYWASSAKLGPIAGPIAAGIMSALTLGLATKQLQLITDQQFIPGLEQGGTASGLTRVHENGGEIFNLPDGTIVIPHDISRQIAKDSGTSNVINVSFSGATISNNMDMNKIVDQVSRKLGRKLRTA